MIDALEQAYFAFPSAYARTKGAEIRKEADCTWCSTPIDFPAYNGFFDLRLGAGDVKGRIEELNAVLWKRNTSFIWSVLPNSTPEDLPELIAEIARRPPEYEVRQTRWKLAGTSGDAKSRPISLVEIVHRRTRFRACER